MTEEQLLKWMWLVEHVEQWSRLHTSQFNVDFFGFYRWP